MIPPVDSNDFVGFSVTVDGRPLTPELAMRAVVGTTDVTATLARHGIKLSRFVPGPRIDEAIARLAESDRAVLAAAGILGPGEIDDFEPKWLLRTAYVWTQSFPAGRPIEIEHRYRPVIGGDWLAREDLETPRWDAWCLDRGTRDALRKRLVRGGAARVTLVEYVLTTGANWAGPIGRFRLTLDKGNKARLLSTCVDGLKRSGSTTWTLERRDFTPAADLRVLLVEPQEKR